MNISEINNPIEKFVAFIAEREAIRVRRFVMKKDPPWTTDPILLQYRFTNVHREDDTVSKHYQEMVRNVYGESNLVLPATVIYRWFNRPSTCGPIFDKGAAHSRSIYELYINSGSISILQSCIENIPTPHVTGAYLISSPEGLPKAEGILQYIDQWMQRDWAGQWGLWKKDPPLLEHMYEWIDGNGLGSFMRGQIVADLKYVKFMLGVPDWYTWATPGPGSQRGLNIVYERPMNQSWKKGEWLPALQHLNEIVTPLLKGYGMGQLHNQDLQNCLCEWSKYTKVERGEGRPRQVFRSGMAA